MSIESAPFRLLEEERPQPRYEPETPFLETFVDTTGETPGSELAATSALLPPAFETPFTAEYFGEAGPADRERVAFGEVLTQLADPEFEEAVAELVSEAAAVHAEQAAQLGETASAPGVADRMLQEWLRPVAEEAEALLESMERAAAQADAAMLSQDEVDRLFEGIEPRTETLGAPVFEDFLGALKRKAVAFAQRATDMARRGLSALGRVLPLGTLLGKLKQLVRPLLDRVLRFALDRLPASVRPLATQLARRLVGRAELSEEASVELEAVDGAPAAPDPATLQREFDVQAASLLLAGDEAEQEMLLGEARSDTAEQNALSSSDLADARARFVERLGELRDGEDPTPALEEFIPAVLMAVRLGIKFIGRQKVVNFLAGFLAPVIARYIGQQGARRLSRAIADTGLRLVSLEAPDLSARESTAVQDGAVARHALAGLVEDTTRGVATLSEEAQEDPIRLEAAAATALNEAAVRTMPPSLLRPDLPERETTDVNGTWVFMPLPKPRYRYKKFTTVFDVTITPQVARSIQAFGGRTLESVLRDQVQVTLPVRARMHLYEAIQGTYLSRIARLDGAPGLRSHRQILPLTTQAAGTLLQQPGLGSTVDQKFLADPNLIAIGQRFYYLEIPGHRPPDPRHPAARPSEVNVTFDLRPGRDETRVAIYLSERDAQEVARQLAKPGPAAVLGAFTLIQKTYAATFQSIFQQPGPHLRLLREDVSQEAFLPALAAAAEWFGKQAAAWLAKKLLDYLASAITGYLRSKAQEFITATRDPRAGVTIIVVLTGTPLQTAWLRALSGKPPSSLDLLRMFAGIRAVPRVTARPGRSW